MDNPTMLGRDGTHSRKWAQAEALGQPARPGLALGISDMDIRAPQVALDAAQAILDHGVLGYGFDLDGYKAAVSGWMARRHGWEVAPDRVLPVPGTLSVLSLAVTALTRPGAAVVHFEPGYKHFRWAVEHNGRRIHAIELEDRTEGMRLPDALEDTELPDTCEMMLICSPHNPTGRVWTADELRRMLSLARRHGLIVVCDEIHMDFAYPGHRHIPIATLATAEDRVIIAAGTTKNFNLAGMALSNAIFLGPSLQEPVAALRESLYMESSNLSYAMATAALSEAGDAWMDATRALLMQNRQTLLEGLAEIEGLTCHAPEATFLAWLRLGGPPEQQADMEDAIARRAAIRVEPGIDFGAIGTGHVRMNFGTSADILAAAMDRLRDVARDIYGT